MRDVARPGPVGLSGVGLALPLGTGSLRALRRRTGQTPQAAHWVGLATFIVGQALLPEREVVVVADDGYASLKLLYRCRRLKNPITFITRLRLYAALYEPAPPRKPRQKGRPRLKDERLPNLSVAAEDPATVWMPLAVSNWYGGRRRTAEVVSKTALWQQRGLARRALAVGADPRSRRRVWAPSPAVHRP